jgi:molybdate/tungstate transport system substrate-binding protein
VAALAVTPLVALGAGPAVAAPPHTGTVDVLYAGSFEDLMQQQLGPAFTRATGYTVEGFSDGSDALATDIKAGTQVGDVFVSASPAVNAHLEGAANGDWVSWDAAFATSPLVLGYNPSSSFAHALRTKPWYDVVDQPGFRLGRTDPATDPKGVLAVAAIDRAARVHHLRALGALASSATDVYPEDSLVGQLQAGQLDAGFFYGVEASAAHLHTVPLTGTHLAAAYTVTVLNRAPHEAAARAFVAFLVGRTGRRIMSENGVAPLARPEVSGRSVPGALKVDLQQ